MSLYTRAKRHVNTIAFLLMVAGGGFTVAMTFASKANASDVEKIRAEVSAIKVERAGDHATLILVKQIVERMELKLDAVLKGRP